MVRRRARRAPRRRTSRAPFGTVGEGGALRDEERASRNALRGTFVPSTRFAAEQIASYLHRRGHAPRRLSWSVGLLGKIAKNGGKMLCCCFWLHQSVYAFKKIPRQLVKSYALLRKSSFMIGSRATLWREKCYVSISRHLAEKASRRNHRPYDLNEGKFGRNCAGFDPGSWNLCRATS